MEVTLKAKLSQEDMHLIAKKVAVINAQEAKPTPKEQEIQYTVKKVAQMTNRTAWTIRNHISIGLLTASKVGKSFLISEENYKKYIKDGE